MDKKKIGSNLVELRKKRNLSQDQVAESLDISRASIAMYEIGERVPSDEVKIKIAAFYKTTVAKIFYS